MKKIISVLVSLVLCLSVSAFAESVPSKTVGDMSKVNITGDNIPADSGFVFRLIVEIEEGHEHRTEICNHEIEKLEQTESVADYFGEVKNAAGEGVDIAAMLESEALNVHEFWPVVAEGYDENYGSVTVEMVFSTPYAKDEKVMLMIGLVTVNEDNTQDVEWIAYEGICVDEQGTIQVELEPEIILAIQNGVALLAVVSR